MPEDSVSLGDPVIFVSGNYGAPCAATVVALNKKDGLVGLLCTRPDYPYVHFSKKDVGYSRDSLPETYHFVDDLPEETMSVEVKDDDPGQPVALNKSQFATSGEPLKDNSDKPLIEQGDKK